MPLIRCIRKEKEEQEKIIDDVSGKSKRECEDILNSLRKEKGLEAPPKAPRVQNESEDSVRLSLSLPKETMEKIKKLQENPESLGDRLSGNLYGYRSIRIIKNFRLIELSETDFDTKPDIPRFTVEPHFVVRIIYIWFFIGTHISEFVISPNVSFVAVN